MVGTGEQWLPQLCTMSPRVFLVSAGSIWGRSPPPAPSVLLASSLETLSVAPGAGCDA